MLAFSVMAHGPEYSRKAFDEGMEYAQKGLPVVNCSTNPATKVFCEEGFWFRDFFLQWSGRADNRKYWAYPFPMSGIQAVSFGMAFAIRFPEIPISFHYLNHLTKYIYDGWGFMTGIQSKEKNIPLKNCPAGEFRRYCEFGRERALFFSANQSDQDIAGLSFARSIHGIETEGRMGIFGKILRGTLPLSASLKNCLLTQHLLDCHPENL